MTSSQPESWHWAAPLPAIAARPSPAELQILFLQIVFGLRKSQETRGQEECTSTLASRSGVLIRTWNHSRMCSSGLPCRQLNLHFEPLAQIMLGQLRLTSKLENEMLWGKPQPLGKKHVLPLGNEQFLESNLKCFCARSPENTLASRVRRMTASPLRMACSWFTPWRKLRLRKRAILD